MLFVKSELVDGLLTYVSSAPPSQIQVKIVGAAMVYRPWLVVLEMMQYGDLKKVMLVSPRQCTACPLRG